MFTLGTVPFLDHFSSHRHDFIVRNSRPFFLERRFDLRAEPHVVGRSLFLGGEFGDDRIELCHVRQAITRQGTDQE